jgi:two-component system sensor histidine kinase TctE
MSTFSLPGARSRPDGAAALPAARGKRLNWPRGVVVALTVLAVFVPLALIFYQSFLTAPFFMPDKTLGLDAFRFIFEDPDFLAAFKNGMLLATGLAVIAVPLGGILAFLMVRTDLPPVPANVPRSELYPALVRFYHADYNGEPVRIAALLQPVFDDSMRGIALIQVGETLDARRALSRRILVNTLVRQAVLVLAVGTLVWFAVRLVLQPLMRLKNEVETRPLSDLSDVDPALVHREVRPLVGAMNGAMGRLQELIAGQRRFIADASHQLRTPLTVLKTQAELALRENDPGAMREIVRSIAATTDSTVHLANRLLTLARIEHGGDSAALMPVSLTEVARQVGLELALPAVQKSIDLALEAPQDAMVQGHALLLHELVSNLLDNAIRYTPVGGAVLLRVSEQGSTVLLEVQDSGAGIPETERDKVFAPFYRAAAALETNPGGTGLGLAIVRDIVALHGGAISLDASETGQGLKVLVRLPAARKTSSVDGIKSA